MLNKKEFREAFREAMEIQLAADEATVASADKDIPEMSPEFRKKMEELIRTGKPNNKKGLSKRGKRILIIAIAAVLALTLTACAVPEIRESIAGFFVKIFSDHVEYSNPDVTKERIEEEYGLVPIPEGFVEALISRTENAVSTTYFDNDQNGMILVQAAKGFRAEYVDSEHGLFNEYEIGGRIVRLYYSEESAQATWIQDGYYFSLTYPGSIDLGIFESWIESVGMK